MGAERGGKGEFLNRRAYDMVTVGVDSGIAQVGDIIFPGSHLPLELPRRYNVINQRPKNDASALFYTTFEAGVPLAGCDSIAVPKNAIVCLYWGEVPKSIRTTIQTFLPKLRE